MRKYILVIFSLLFFAFVFQSDKPMGWYVQPTPVNDVINDIFFLDSLRGWAVTDGNPQSNDTAYIMRTTDGGVNWVVQFHIVNKLNTIQFLDSNIGYAGGGFGVAQFLKTTNGGANWQVNSPFGSSVNDLLDLKFINQDTGWFCSDDNLGGGIFKTTNAGINWVRQLDQTYLPKKLFFLNQDTGWVLSGNRKLYKTSNSGNNWLLLYDFNTSNISDFCFVNDTGYVAGGNTQFKKTTNGGTNWTNLNAVDGDGVTCVFFINNKVGWFGGSFLKIYKTIDGQTVRRQTSASFTTTAIQFIDTNVGYGAGTKIMKTTDGGGLTPIFENNSNVPSDYKLYQNYPNPFNPVTSFKFQVSSSNYVTIKVYDLRGKEIAVLVSEKKNAGNYSINFDANKYNLSSGIYFYTLEIDGAVKDTKKMMLIK